MIQVCNEELVEAGLVELALQDCKYASAMVIGLSKKDTYDNWTKKRMFGDQRTINKFIKFNRYAILTLEENFEAIGYAKVFGTFDLRSGYHQIGLREEVKEKTAFYKDGKDRLY